MKADRVKVSRELLGHFEEQWEGFLWQIVTGDESWVHHCDPENRRLSMEYYHKELPSPKNSKPMPLLENSSLLYFGTLKVLYSLTSWKKVLE